MIRTATKRAVMALHGRGMPDPVVSAAFRFFRLAEA